MAAAVFLLAGAAISTRAQGGPPPGLGMPANNDLKRETREMEIRQGRLRSAELDATSKKGDEHRIEASIVQVKEDFARIQVVRNEIAHKLVARAPLDYHLIANQTEEIYKRANRLKAYMLFHSPEEKGKDEQNPSTLESEEMTSALVRLCKLIDGFVENPALKNAAMVDAQHLEKARKDKAQADNDLVNIVELSSRVHKRAERMNKTSQ